MNDSLGARIRSRMDTLGLKQVDLVRAANVSRPTVHAWVNGDVAELKHKHVEAVARVLKCRPRWLTAGTGPMEFDEGYSASHIASEPEPATPIAFADKHIKEATELLLSLPSADRREAVAWLRGFAAGRKREAPKRDDSAVAG